MHRCVDLAEYRDRTACVRLAEGMEPIVVTMPGSGLVVECPPDPGFAAAFDPIESTRTPEEVIASGGESLLDPVEFLAVGHVGSLT